MKFIALGSILALATVVTAAALPEGASVGSAIAGYETGIMEFVGTIYGVNFTAKGTAEEVYNAFTKAHPDAVTNETIPVTPHQLSKSDLYCCNQINQPWGWANTGRIGEGISYLNKLGGTCNVGGKSCVRISCSWNAAIYLCNNGPDTITPKCDYIASYASDITHQCTRVSPAPIWYQLTCGQEFDTDAYNVIVHSDSC